MTLRTKLLLSALFIFFQLVKHTKQAAILNVELRIIKKNDNQTLSQNNSTQINTEFDSQTKISTSLNALNSTETIVVLWNKTIDAENFDSALEKVDKNELELIKKLLELLSPNLTNFTQYVTNIRENKTTLLTSTSSTTEKNSIDYYDYNLGTELTSTEESIDSETEYADYETEPNTKTVDFIDFMSTTSPTTSTQTSTTTITLKPSTTTVLTTLTSSKTAKNTTLTTSRFLDSSLSTSKSRENTTRLTSIQTTQTKPIKHSTFTYLTTKFNSNFTASSSSKSTTLKPREKIFNASSSSSSSPSNTAHSTTTSSILTSRANEKLDDSFYASCTKEFENYCLNKGECFLRFNSNKIESFCECNLNELQFYDLVRVFYTGTRCEIQHFRPSILGIGVLCFLVAFLALFLCSCFYCACFLIYRKEKQNKTSKQNHNENSSLAIKNDSSDISNGAPKEDPERVKQSERLAKSLNKNSWKYLKFDENEKNNDNNRNVFEMTANRLLSDDPPPEYLSKQNTQNRFIQHYLNKRKENLLRSFESLAPSINHDDMAPMTSAQAASAPPLPASSHSASSPAKILNINENFIFINRTLNTKDLVLPSFFKSLFSATLASSKKSEISKTDNSDKLEARCASNIFVYPRPSKASVSNQTSFSYKNENENKNENETNAQNEALYY